MAILRTQTLINISILATDLILLTNEAIPSVIAIHVIFLRQYINNDIDQNTLREIWIAIPRSNRICISSTYKCMCFYTCEMDGNMGNYHDALLTGVVSVNIHYGTIVAGPWAATRCKAGSTHQCFGGYQHLPQQPAAMYRWDSYKTWVLMF